jgi:hypothetical protein
MPEESTDVGIALLIILILIRDVVLPLIKGDPWKMVLEELRKINATLESYQSKITDLHDWHKPDSSGRQSWKDDSIDRAIQADVGRLFSRINDWCSDIKASVDHIPAACLIKDRHDKRE